MNIKQRARKGLSLILALTLVLGLFAGGFGLLDTTAQAASNPAQIPDYSGYTARSSLTYDPNTTAAGSYTDVTLSNGTMYQITTSGAYRITGGSSAAPLINASIYISGNIEVDLIIDNLYIRNTSIQNFPVSLTETGAGRIGYGSIVIANGAKVWLTLVNDNLLEVTDPNNSIVNAAIFNTITTSLIFTERSETSTGNSQGSLRAIGGRCSAAIGGVHDTKSGFIMINGGDITAIADKPNGYAAIGGGHYNSVDGSWCPGIVINGGTIFANGGHVGIGGWYGKGTSGSSVPGSSLGAGVLSFIEINGGTITAQNNANGISGGAAIGFVTENDLAPIHINGGDITAMSYGFGAGIGGSATIGNTINAIGETVSGTPAIFVDMRSSLGYGAGIGGGGMNASQTSGGTDGTSAGDMLIMGGDITIYANANGAGIGGGGGTASGAGGNIDISGGNFTIYGGTHGAGIGGGGSSTANGGDGGNVEITGGRFTIYGGTYGAGIGGGGSVAAGGGSGGNVVIDADTTDDVNNMFDIYAGKYAAGIGGGGSLNGNGGGGGSSVEISGGNFNIATGYEYTAAGTPSTLMPGFSYGAGIGGGGAGGAGNGGNGSNSFTVSGGRFNSTSNGYGAGIGGGGSNSGTAGTGGTALYNGGTVEVTVPGSPSSAYPASIGSVGMGGGHVANGSGSKTTDGEVTITGGNIYTEIASVVGGNSSQHAWTLPYPSGVTPPAGSNNTSTTTAIKIELDTSEIGLVADEVAFFYNNTSYFDYGTDDMYVTAGTRAGDGSPCGILWVWVPSEYYLTYDLTSGRAAGSYTSTVSGGGQNDFDIGDAARLAVGFTYVTMDKYNSSGGRVYNYPGETKNLLNWNELILGSSTYDGSTWNAAAPGANYHAAPGNELYQLTEHDDVLYNGGNTPVYLIGWAAAPVLETDGVTEHIFAEGDGWDYAQYVIDEAVFTDRDITVYAVWGYDENGNGTPDVREDSYRLSYDANGGSGAPTNPMTYRYGDTAGIASLEPSYTGHVFLGWSTVQVVVPYDINATAGGLPSMYRNAASKDYNGMTISYSTDIPFANNNIILYAVWAEDANGNGNPDFLDDVRYLKHVGNGATATLPDIPYVDGQTGTSHSGSGLTHSTASNLFLGWTEDASAAFLITASHTAADLPGDLADPITLSAAFSGGDISVYAVWAEDNNGNSIPDYQESTFSFIYDTQTSGSVTGIPADSTGYYEGDTISADNDNLLNRNDALDPANGTGMTEYMQRSGYVLLGWTDTVPAQNDFTVAMADAYALANAGIYPDDPSLYLATVANLGPNGNGTFGQADISIYAVWGEDSNNNGVPDWSDEDGRRVQYIPTIGSVDAASMPFYNAGTPGLYYDNGPGAGSSFTNYTSDETVGLSAQRPTANGYVFLGWSPVYISGQVFGENGLTKTNFYELVTLIQDIRSGGNFSGKNGVGYMDPAYGSVATKFAEVGYAVAAGLEDRYADLVSGTAATLPQAYDSFDWYNDFDGQGFLTSVTFDAFNATKTAVGGDTSSETWRLYAIWGKDVNGNGAADIFEDFYSLYYKTDVDNPAYIRATGGPSASHNKFPGETVALDIVNKPGKLDDNNDPMIFLGWTVDNSNLRECYGFNDNAGDVPALASAVTFGNFDITVYAVWALDTNKNNIPDVYENLTYSLTYDANGGDASSVPVDNNSYGYGDPAVIDTATTPTHPGNYIFLYWTPDASVAQEYGFGDRASLPAKATDFTFTNASVTLYAVWGEDTNNNNIPDVYEDGYTLTYNANGGDPLSVPVDTTAYTWNQTVTLDTATTPSHGSYVFVGWTEADPGTFSSIYYAGQASMLPPIVTGVTFDTTDVTVYAVWSTDYNGNGIPDVNEDGFVVAYDANGGTNPPAATNPYPAGASIVIAGQGSMAKGTDTFNGWNTEADGSGTGYAAGGTLTISANVTLYAQWSSGTVTPPGPGPGPGPGTTCTVTYNANGGNGSHSVTVSSGGSHTVLSASAAGISFKGYTFTGWNTTSNGSGTSYAAGSSLTVNSNVTLYAQWKKDSGTTNPTLETDDHIQYIQGYPDGSVRPDGNITRAETAIIFFRLLNAEAHSDRYDPVGNHFSDIKGTEWHAQAINYMASIGIVNGYSDGTFKPDTPITRAEFATIAARFDDLSYTDSNVFTDVANTHWAVAYINSAYLKGWVTGYSDSTFQPEKYITRGEAVTLVNRMLNRAIDEEALEAIKNPYNDIRKSHWAYAAIMEASYKHDYERDAGGIEHWTKY